MMKQTAYVLFLLLMTMVTSGFSAGAPKPAGYSGSGSCKECHDKFHTLWATSRHGLAMRPFTREFAEKELSPQKEEIVIGKNRYRAEPGPGPGRIIETSPRGSERYKIDYVLGGKNVYYFLATIEKGRLQTLPIAYDVSKKEWFDTAASGVRHYSSGTAGEDEPIHWKDRAYTFNTACYSCHVSQLSTNYDRDTDSYTTTWTETGINCETCHGPAEEHIAAARILKKGQPLEDYKIIRTKIMSKEQRNFLCAPCHAKMIPLTGAVPPGGRFFDYFDLVGLEDPDFYPDGRDLGENYTYTGWLMSSCAKSGKMDCMHCHTSSGRYRFPAGEKANEACLPCHDGIVKSSEGHTHHKQGSSGSTCISCHMPATSFARMKHTDHTMQSPAPSATIDFKSPNACTLCHKDRDTAWADGYVREWYSRDYQKSIMKRARLIESARKGDWSRIPETLEYVQSKERDEIVSASLIRLLMSSRDERLEPVLLKAIKDPSPLVRSAAVEALSVFPSGEAMKALQQAAGDEYRIVRIRAAAGLAGYPAEMQGTKSADSLQKATMEYLAFIMARPDHWSAYYNMGNYQLSRGEFKEAVRSYQASLTLEPRTAMPLVNASIAYARLGENDKAEEALRRALDISPENAAANFNMGLLKAGRKKNSEAEEHLRKALKTDPGMAQAAYNLCILCAENRMDEAVAWCQKAADISPGEPRYAYTLAYYAERKGDSASAVKTLQSLVERHPTYGEAYLMLGGIYENLKKIKEAERVYSAALRQKGIPTAYHYQIKSKLDALKLP